MSSEEVQGNRDSQWPDISADGRYVLFESYAWNLVPGDTNHAQDDFVRDRVTGKTERVSVSSEGKQGYCWRNGLYPQAISDNGRYVAFQSCASNLVPDDENQWDDIFVHDRVTGKTEMVSVSSRGEQGDLPSELPTINTDGRFVAFWSEAHTLVPGDTKGYSDTFVHDRVTGETWAVSVTPEGTVGNNNSFEAALSADGRYVAFDSAASDLVPGDTNGWNEVFVRDTAAAKTERVSIGSQGQQANGFSERAAISADGRYVAFRSTATNLVPNTPDTAAGNAYDVFVHDRLTGKTERVGRSPRRDQGYVFGPDMSADGRFVTYESSTSDLVPGDTNGVADVFLFDRLKGTTERVSVDSRGGQQNGPSAVAAISAEGDDIAFDSTASNLVRGDTNGAWDVFVHSRKIPAAWSGG